MMTTEELEAALDRWGADFDRWPSEAGERARATVAMDPTARRLFESARELETFLEGLRPHAAPAHLAGRIAARVRETPDRIEVMLGWLTARIWRPAVLAMVMVSAGYLTGVIVQEPLDDALVEEVMTLAFSDIYAELEDAQP